jgi:Cd2+/Zn2+-exporting ATPase
MDDEREIKSVLPPILLTDMLLIACCVVSAVFFAWRCLRRWMTGSGPSYFTACIMLLFYDLLFDAVMKFINERVFDHNVLAIIAAVGALSIGWGEAGAAAALIYRIGAVVNRLMAERSVITAESMLDIRPEVVNAVVNGAIVQMSAGRIEVGDIISVAPGEHIAFDGIVSGGESALDISVMTGQTAPRPGSAGSKVMSGSLNLTGVLNIRVTSDFDHSVVSRVVKYLNDAETRKSKPEKTAEWLARLFMPAACGVAVIVGLIVPLIGGLSVVPWLGRAFGILFISSLSAQAISIQLTYFNSIAGALKRGILFKGADVIDTLAHATSVVFDMTGILTDGRFAVAAVQPNGITSDRLMTLAAYAAANATTPVMRAITAEADVDVDFTKINDYRPSYLGGYEVDIGNVTVAAGGEAFMAELGITPDISQTEASAVYVAVNGPYVGRILLTDAIRPDSKRAVRQLQANGVDRIAMFTGDNIAAAGEAATQIGIQELYTEKRPEEKIARLNGLHDMQLKGDRLIFVGDASDDPSVLRRADAGIVMGGLESQAVEEAADMIIMTDTPSKVAEAIVLARHTDSIVGQNIPALLGVKGVVLLLLLFGVFPIWAGVLADVLLTLGAILNAMRAFGMTREEIRRSLTNKPADVFDTGYEYYDDPAY